MNTKILAAGAAALVLAAGAASAQTTAAPTDTATTYPDAAVAPVEDDDGMDFGWLGLLGLAGLLGLRKRRVEDVRTHSTTPSGLNR